jgi:hypothetical protein
MNQRLAWAILGLLFLLVTLPASAEPQTVAIWNVDVSTAMSYSSEFCDEDRPVDEARLDSFRFEPWTSTWAMLERFVAESGVPSGIVAAYDGPGSDWRRPWIPSHYAYTYEPGVGLDELAAVQREQVGPAGWYAWEHGMRLALDMAIRASEAGHRVEAFVANSGPHAGGRGPGGRVHRHGQRPQHPSGRGPSRQ